MFAWLNRVPSAQQVTLDQVWVVFVFLPCLAEAKSKDAVRDLHAEILARRGLLRFLHEDGMKQTRRVQLRCTRITVTMKVLSTPLNKWWLDSKNWRVPGAHEMCRCWRICCAAGRVRRLSWWNGVRWGGGKVVCSTFQSMINIDSNWQIRIRFCMMSKFDHWKTILFDIQSPGRSEVSRTISKITQEVCSWFYDRIKQVPVGTRSAKFSFEISPVSVGHSGSSVGFERVVFVWRWCSLVFEKTWLYIQQVICLLWIYSFFLHLLTILLQDNWCKLRDDVSLHLYTSSVPCGNASWKRWAKGGSRSVHFLTAFPTPSAS